MGWTSFGVLARVVLQVGVLDDHEIAGRGRESRAQRRALALVLLVIQHADARLSFELLQFVARAVRRVIVNDDDFPAQPERFEWDGADGGDDLMNGGALVEDGHDDGEFHSGIPVCKVCGGRR